MPHRPLGAFFAVVIACLIFVNPVKADPVTITFTNPNQVGTPGSTLIFTGIITNTGTAPVSIVYGEMVFWGGSLFGNFDFSDTIKQALPFTLAAGQSTGEIELATFIITPIFSGPFPATERVRYMLGINSSDNRVSQDFTVTAIEAVPEPATMILFGTGLAVIVAKRRRQRRVG